MKVTKSRSESTPSYPSRRQFRKSGVLLGIAAVGLGAVAGGCLLRPAGKIATEPRKPDPVTLGGVPAIEQAHTMGVISVEPRAYTVKPGDTLYGIAKQTLGKGSRWTEISALNKGLHPDRLQTGQTLMLPEAAP